MENQHVFLKIILSYIILIVLNDLTEIMLFSPRG